MEENITQNQEYENEELRDIIAKNLVYFRKASKLTQLELAEKLLYSDKNISKWERGEAIPDVIVLSQLAELYHITVNDFLISHDGDSFVPAKPLKKRTKVFNTKQLMITLLSNCIVWLVAVCAFCIFINIFPALKGELWKIFVVAIPICFIICLVFSSIWCTNTLNCIFVSLLTWSVALAFCVCLPFEFSWLSFIIAIPVQVLALLWFTFRKIKVKDKQKPKEAVK